MGHGVTAVPVQEHVYDPVKQVCVHCHVPKYNVDQALANHQPITCVYRWVDSGSIAREERPAHRAADDFEMIGARLAQLRVEREETELAKAPTTMFERSLSAP